MGAHVVADDAGSNIPAVDDMEIVGGRLATMFVNTANWVDESAIDDRVTDPASLMRWARRVGLLGDDASPAEPAVGWAEGTLDPAAIRERMREVLIGRVAHPRAALETSIATVDGQNDTNVEIRYVMRAVLFSAVELVVTDRSDRVRECPGPRCGWLFVDDSPGGRRRWCSMASCGNRAKAQRHYRQARQRA